MHWLVAVKLTFEQIFDNTIAPIWDYGKHDRLFQNKLHHLLVGFLIAAPDTEIATADERLITLIKKRRLFIAAFKSGNIVIWVVQIISINLNKFHKHNIGKMCE